jgi:hypothetical protein
LEEQVNVIQEYTVSRNHRNGLRIVKPSAEQPRAATSGKVTHDARGTAVWDWAVDTGVLSQKSAAELLDTLADPAGLTLAGETKERSPSEWRGDPYNRTRK